MKHKDKISPPRVVIADDHIHARQMIERFLVGTYDIVGSVGDGRALIEIVRAAEPNLVVVDVDMPVMTGIQALPLLRQYCPEANIVVMTVTEDEGLAKHALELGANAFVIKSRLAKDFDQALAAVALGRTFISSFGMASEG